MTAISRLLDRLSMQTGPEHGFEAYYRNLLRQATHGVPSAAEARRDYERLMRSYNPSIFG